ncbi:unnamed protein product (macronuclear) [Paramecium tetraurelia]|uniref:Uncharacterized protein n=1 Tax=Paramecium tetraurelia TaxID=5888 RepID=A0CMI7_PARTE|nr:uncharacterized protein GSPATT00008483001 [Paramecium tetraurelia]CAK72004.1 unnamed protein product [Paramecium tetraurelia]|eukprot:XP_001439401.1 hypothetical protein (macronuclear) [Paramecium tetraurelia strain d4-2]
MHQQTAKFVEVLPNYDQLRINELKQIEQEQYYISQLKEQRERMEVLKEEFLKKDQTITDFQIQNQKLREELNKMRVALSEQIKHQEKEKQRIKKYTQERDQLMNDNQELRDLVQHLREENENLNSLQLEKQRQFEEYVVQQQIENEQLKAEISKLDELLFGTEPLKAENNKLKAEIKEYKNEKKKIQHDIRQSRIEMNQQLDEFKLVIQDQHQEIAKLQQYKEMNNQLKQNYQEFEHQFKLLKQENLDLKLELKRFYDKEESEIKMKSEIDRVRQDLISVRNQEVEKLNELFKGIFQRNSLEQSREKYI